MRRPSRLLSTACLAVVATLACTLGPGVPPAAADTTDGTLTVTVVLDDGSGGYDGADLPQSGIGVTVTDAGGNTVERVTGDEGRAVVEPGDELAGGRYFVAVELPEGLGLLPAGGAFTPLSSTVDVSSESQDVVVGLSRVPAPEPTPVGTEAARASPPPPPPPAADPEPTTTPPVAPRFAVGDRVWRDLNGQGRQDDGEPGLAGVTVQLLDADGGVLATTTTDRDGRYLFDDLAAGLYSVRFAGLATGTKLSPAGVGGLSRDSDADYTGVTAPFQLAEGGADVRRSNGSDRVTAGFVNATVDAGVADLTFAVASVVWQDLDHNGVLDPDEPAGQAAVDLLDAGDRLEATTRTDDQGRYVFAGLSAGYYRLQFHDLGAHRQLTTAGVGSNRAVDSAPDAEDGRTARFHLGAGEPDLVPAAAVGDVDADFVLPTLNAGTVGSYTISNRVWSDRNGDGLMNEDEAGVLGVRVQLRGAADDVVATTTTNADGWFAFGRLTAGRYRLRFSPPEGLYFTRPRTGGEDDTDSAVYGNHFTAPVILGEDNPVETAVAAGLTTLAARAAGTTAPPLTALPTGAALAPVSVLAEEGGVPWALPLVGLLLVAAGGCLMVARRRRRRAG